MRVQFLEVVLPLCLGTSFNWDPSIMGVISYFDFPGFLPLLRIPRLIRTGYAVYIRYRVDVPEWWEYLWCEYRWLIRPFPIVLGGFRFM